MRALIISHIRSRVTSDPTSEVARGQKSKMILLILGRSERSEPTAGRPRQSRLAQIYRIGGLVFCTINDVLVQQ